MLKFYKFEEEKNKVGRPKLADEKTKKKAIISVCVALVLVLTLALTGAFKLNIINFNRLKGTVNTSLCTEIPAEFQPGGNHEYGFTDPKFYSAVLSGSSYNDEAYCSTMTEEMLNSISTLTIVSSSIDNTDGIEYLTGLTYLYLYNSNISSIDLSKNTSLIYLDLHSNNLSSIDLSNNTSLTNLNLNTNNLSSIDLSNNKLITTLKIKENKNLSYLDLSGNTAMTSFTYNGQEDEKYLLCGKLTSINVSGMTALTSLDLSYNNLTSIDLSSNTSLTTLNLKDNNISDIDLSSNTALTSLNLWSNNLTSIDLSNNTSLTSLNLYSNNNLNSIDLSNNNVIMYVESSYSEGCKDYYAYMPRNNITDFNLSGMSNLRSLSLYKVENLDISNDINLGSVSSRENYLDLSNKGIKNINLSGDFFTSLNLANNNITSINLNNTIIYSLDLSYNNLSSIDLNGVWEFFDEENNELYTYKMGEWLHDLNISNNNLTSIDLSSNTALTSLTLNNNNLNELDLSNNVQLSYLNISDNEVEKIIFPNSNSLETILSVNNNLSSIDLSKLLELKRIYLKNNNLEEVVLPEGDSLETLYLSNNNLTSIDLSKYDNLFVAILDHNKLEKVVLGSSENLVGITLSNNNLRNIDLSGVQNLELLTLENNPIMNTIYMLKDNSLKYNENVTLNENIKLNYSVDDDSIISYDNGTLKALKEGTTTVNVSSESMFSWGLEYEEKCSYNDEYYTSSEYYDNKEYCINTPEEEAFAQYILTNEIKVYDVTSDVYEIDKENKTIDVSGLELDTSKVTITLEGLTGVKSGNTYVVKDGDTTVDTYTILNQKTQTNNSSSNNTTTNKSSSNTTTNNSSSGNTSSTKSNSKVTTTKEDLSDIEIEGSFVSILALQQIKDKDRNIVVTNDGITITINGKDIESIEGNLDLSYTLEILKESLIYEEVSEKIQKGVVLTFNSNSNLPGKVLIELDVNDIIKNNAGIKNLNIYSYSDGELTLIAKNVDSKNNKLSFYINELGNYILTDNVLEDQDIKVDTNLLESNNNINKSISFKYILWVLLILIVLGIIGYIFYKKNKVKNS